MNTKTREQEWEPAKVPQAEAVRTALVYKAITKVIARLAKDGISKDRSNQQQNYKFRGIDDVYNALSGCLSDAQLCIMPRVLRREVKERETKSGGVLFYVVLDVEFDFVSAEDGSKHTVAVIGEAMDSGDKATNKAMSAAYKYACLQTFCIPTEGDNDADATTHEITPAQRSRHTKSVNEYAKRVLDALNLDMETAAVDIMNEAKAYDENFVADIWHTFSTPVKNRLRALQSQNG